MSDSTEAAAAAIRDHFQELCTDYETTQDNIVRLQSHQRKLLAKIDAYIPTARLLGLELSRPQTMRAHGNGQSIKTIILELAEESYPRPVQAGEVRQQLVSMGYPIHPKTVTMTFSRWAVAGRMRRDCQGWYFVPKPTRETPKAHHRPQPERTRALELA
jgi:hypothetical protein